MGDEAIMDLSPVVLSRFLLSKAIVIFSRSLVPVF